MSQPRRRFLQQLVLASGALAFGRVRAGSNDAKPAGEPGYSAFATQIGHDFTARTAATMATLKLAEVARPKNLRGYPDAAKSREQNFTLVFKGEAATRLPEGIYTLSAVGVAPFDAFLSPIRGDKLSYQVVFNRI